MLGSPHHKEMAGKANNSKRRYTSGRVQKRRNKKYTRFQFNIPGHFQVFFSSAFFKLQTNHTTGGD